MYFAILPDICFSRRFLVGFWYFLYYYNQQLQIVFCAYKGQHTYFFIGS